MLGFAALTCLAPLPTAKRGSTAKLCNCRPWHPCATGIPVLLERGRGEGAGERAGLSTNKPSEPAAWGKAVPGPGRETGREHTKPDTSGGRSSPAPTSSSQGRPPYRLPTDPHASSTFPVTPSQLSMGTAAPRPIRWGRGKSVFAPPPPPPAQAPVSSLSYNTGQHLRPRTWRRAYFHLEPPETPILPDQGPENSSTLPARALLLLGGLRCHRSWGPDSHSPSTPSPSLREPLDPPGHTHPQCQPRGCHCCCLHR